jgi:hypothetical protein
MQTHLKSTTYSENRRSWRRRADVGSRNSGTLIFGDKSSPAIEKARFFRIASQAFDNRESKPCACAER